MGKRKYEFKKLNTILVYQIDIPKSIKIFFINNIFSVRFGQFLKFKLILRN